MIPAMRLRTLAITFALMIVGCGNEPIARRFDASPEAARCPVIAGSACTCGVSVGVWRCAAETPVCQCALPDGSMDAPSVVDGTTSSDAALDSRIALEDASKDAIDATTAADAVDVKAETAVLDTPDAVADVIADVAVDLGDAAFDVSDHPGDSRSDINPTCTPGASECFDMRIRHLCAPDGVTFRTEICADRANAAGICTAGECSFRCATNFGDCDDVVANGCETALRGSTTHCGLCGNACSVSANATPSCNGSVCGFTCNSGFGDCDGNAANGCEVDLQTDSRHCGVCGATCLIACGAGNCVDFRVIGAGDHHNCAVLVDGTARCWGANAAGQLGDGTMSTSTLRARVVALSSAREIVGGALFTCARTSAGTVSCWGANDNGQLGDGTYVGRATPGVVREVGNSIGVAAGLDHACSLGADHQIVCWGYNPSGGLGAATAPLRSPVPLAVVNASAVFTQVTAGFYFTCALTSTGVVQCWGSNSNGQVGDGTMIDRRAPTIVDGLPVATRVAAGAYHVCALLEGGRVACWGHNEAGAIGDGTVVARTRPVLVTGIEDAVSVAAGDYHTCAIRRGGEVMCWGFNDHGQIGDGTTTNRLNPVTVSGSFRATALALRGRHTCALGVDGRLYCWGDNASGELGDGTRSDRGIPTRMAW